VHDTARICPGTFTVGGQRSTTRVGRWGRSGAGQPMFVQTDVAGDPKYGGGSYVTVLLIDSFIQMVNVYPGTASTTPGQRTAARGLSARLARRLAERTALPVRQDALLTSAERAMLTTSDVPASTPVTPPVKGGWYSFYSYDPSLVGPMVCDSQARIPAGAGSFTASVGGDGGVASMPGGMTQSLEVYPSAATAQRAWRALTSAVSGCSEGAGSVVSPSRPVSRQSNGVSTLTFDGTQGVWSREFDTFPDGGFTAKSYTIHLLVGSAIQSVTYYAAIDAIKDFPLDQLAVNTLAEQLAHRWVDTK
jgi:hypothetical protein